MQLASLQMLFGAVDKLEVHSLGMEGAELQTFPFFTAYNVDPFALIEKLIQTMLNINLYVMWKELQVRRNRLRGSAENSRKIWENWLLPPPILCTNKSHIYTAPESSFFLKLLIHHFLSLTTKLSYDWSRIFYPARKYLPPKNALARCRNLL